MHVLVHVHIIIYKHTRTCTCICVLDRNSTCALCYIVYMGSHAHVHVDIQTHKCPLHIAILVIMIFVHVHGTGVFNTCIQCTSISVYDNTYMLMSCRYYWYNSALQASDSIDTAARFNWQMFLCLLLAWFVVYLCLFKGIQSSGKVGVITIERRNKSVLLCGVVVFA